MRHLKSYKVFESTNVSKIRDLDWSLIKDCLLETFDSVNTKVIFYFYSCNFNGGRKDDWYYNKYYGSSFGYGNSRITDIFTYDPENDKRENQPEDGDIFLRSYPNGSGLWGIEFKFEISDDKKIESISELNGISNFFDKCRNLSDDISSTVERLLDKYDYKIGFEKDLFSDNSEKQFYHIKFSIWDREIREIMEREYRYPPTNFIN